MNKSELIQAIADEAELSKLDAAAFVDAFVSVVTQAMKDGKDVTLVGFGSFHTAQSAERKGRNPKTGEPLIIAARKTPKFRAGKALKDAVNR
ncbi:dna-binding protein HU-beta 2 [Neisseria lactamica 020-06]|uniref:Dna-binding protein HU-beta 2 n=1 Tax=Neisseria lactamica (strain 020-06) TaxID=489653 RepID=E4ZB24_NEIL0|nr:dna-binding protein HU-beta 2 [Neisseria lactamica 020-06]SUA15088.1 dna-binding protein HU-beta 2 [Neisseria lactamica]